MNEDSFFLKRRSVRNFTDRPVDDQLLNDLLAEAVHAPTTGNMQLYSIIVNRDPQMLKRLSACHFNQPASTGCPVMVTFCVDFNRFEHWCDINNARHGYGNLQSLMMGLFDTVIVAQQFVTAAEMRGLSTCYLGTTTYTAPEIGEILEIPDRVVPVMTVALGYAAAMPEDCGRLPLEAVVHQECYKDYTDEDIRRLYAEKEARDDSRGFVAENSKENLAQVFTDIRYPESTLSEFSKVFADLLKEKGF